MRCACVCREVRGARRTQFMYYTTSPETGRGARAAVSISLSLRATRHAPRPARPHAAEQHTTHASSLLPLTYLASSITAHAKTNRGTHARHTAPRGPQAQQEHVCLPCVVEHANGDALTHIWSYHNVNVTLLTACSHADTLINPRVRPTGRTVVCATRSHLNTSDFSPPESCMPGPFLNAATSVWIASCVFLMDGRSRMSITAHAPAFASTGCPKS